MRINLIIVLFLLCKGNDLMAQLSGEFHGAYVNQAFDQAFLIYEVDELSEHCFLVDYEKIVDGAENFLESGYGYCDDKDGSRAVFFLDSYKGPIEAVFKETEEGEIVLYVRFPGATESILFIRMDDMPESEQEILFEREDGAQLVMYDTELGDIGFTIYGVMTYTCENMEVSGILHPTDDTGSVLVAYDASGCEIRIVLLEMGAIVQEKNCEGLRDKGCGSWAGNYLFRY